MPREALPSSAGFSAGVPGTSPPAPAKPVSPSAASADSGGGASGPSWLAKLGQDLSGEFALVRRVQALFAGREMPAGGGEWPKPDYTLAWPAGLDERDPDIGRVDLPVNLSTILRDLDAMRSASDGRAPSWCWHRSSGW